MRLALIGMAMLIFAIGYPQTVLASCNEDAIDTVSEDGDLIILASGDSYDVDAGDELTASAWSEGDDVLICGSTIIDKDQSGEQVEATPH